MSISTFVFISTFLINSAEYSYGASSKNPSRQQWVRDYVPTCVLGPNINGKIRARGGGKKQVRKYCICAGNELYTELKRRHFKIETLFSQSVNTRVFNYCIKRL
jgi:hypothetical protein